MTPRRIAIGIAISKNVGSSDMKTIEIWEESTPFATMREANFSKLTAKSTPVKAARHPKKNTAISLRR
jgi:hypothetical protein